MTNDIENLWKSMHKYELEVFPLIKNKINFENLEKQTNLDYVEIMRALQWLENKKLIQIEKKLKEIIVLGKNGIKYKKEKLPEVRFIENIKNVIKNVNKTKFTIKELKEDSGIPDYEFNIVLGRGRKLGLLNLNEGIITINEDQIEIVKKQSGQDVLENINENKPLFDNFNEFDKHLILELQKRKDILSIEKKTLVTINLTDLGAKALKNIPNIEKLKNQEEKLTPEMLKNGSWKNKSFRPFDVSINVPKIYGGKRHFVNQSIEYIRKIWIELGFKEMEGSFVQTAFRDLDVLYVPQDHPARTMQDTFYIKNPDKGEIPIELGNKIKEVHENGDKTNSTGWKYKWNMKEAEQILLRTHTTVLSAKTLLNKNLKIPGKYFAIGKNFRNETLDWKHLFEFFQVEGIVIGDDVNLAQLKGYLKDFYTKMGYKDVRMRPAHFPYTEPSMEIEVLHPKGKWIELGGAGIFRPEVSITLLGRDIPVLAWGQGMERIISAYYEITDIREIYKNDLKQLKEMKLWIK